MKGFIHIKQVLYFRGAHVFLCEELWGGGPFPRQFPFFKSQNGRRYWIFTGRGVGGGSKRYSESLRMAEEGFLATR